MGDKTQLVALAFATRYKATTVLAGVFGATLLVHLFSVGIGEAASTVVSASWIKFVSGFAFIVFGVWSIYGDEIGNEPQVAEHRWGPLMTVAGAFFLAELGDKTMLATVTIAGQQRHFPGVWLGSTVGMVGADGIAIAVAKGMRKRVPEKLIRYIAGVIFIGSGILTMLHD